MPPDTQNTTTARNRAEREQTVKTFKQILEDIRTTSAAIEASNARQDDLLHQWQSVEDIRARRAKLHELEGEIAAAEERTRDLKLTRRLMQNNARLALYAEVMPAVVETLTRYAGKPYGEKTRAKIAEELRQRTGARVYFGTRYGDQSEVSIYPDMFGNTYALTVGTVSGAHLFDGNRLQPLPLEAFQLWYVRREYFEDIPATLAAMKSLYARAAQLQRELDAACSEFNLYAVDGIENLSANKHIYDRLTAD